MAERGASEAEVVTAVEHGEQYPVKFGRSGFVAISSMKRDGEASFTGPNNLR